MLSRASQGYRLSLVVYKLGNTPQLMMKAEEKSSRQAGNGFSRDHFGLPQ